MVTLSDEDKEPAEQFQTLINAYLIAFKQLGSIRQQLITHAREHRLILAEKGNDKKGEDRINPLYIGPNPFGLDTKTYKASQWRIVTGPHAKRYADKYFKSDITQPPIIPNPYKDSVIAKAIHSNDPYGISLSSDPFTF